MKASPAEAGRLVVAVSNHQHGRKPLLDAVQAKSKEVDEFKERLNSLKRKARDDEPNLRYKSNKKQYKFNPEVKEKFSQIAESPGVDKALQAIATQGMPLINNRNKLIAIADRDSWAVEERFEADPLTNNDEEEKKLRTARELMKIQCVALFQGIVLSNSVTSFFLFQFPQNTSFVITRVPLIKVILFVKQSSNCYYLLAARWK